MECSLYFLKNSLRIFKILPFHSADISAEVFTIVFEKKDFVHTFWASNFVTALVAVGHGVTHTDGMDALPIETEVAQLLVVPASIQNTLCVPTNHCETKRTKQVLSSKPAKNWSVPLWRLTKRTATKADANFILGSTRAEKFVSILQNF